MATMRQNSGHIQEGRSNKILRMRGARFLTVREGNYKYVKRGNSLAVQWLGLRAFTADGPGLIPGWGTRIPQEAQ